MKLPPFFLAMWLAAWLIAGLSANGAAAAEAAGVDGWIAQLDSDQYQAREQATQQLLAAGIEALDELTKAANSSRPEQADRAAWIMQQLAKTGGPAIRQQVLEHLARVDKQPQVAAAAREELAQIKHHAAIQAIIKLGARLNEQQIDPLMQLPNAVQVILDENWRGGDEGLKHFGDVRNLAIVTVIGTDVSAAGLEQLEDAEAVRRLDLFGTSLADSDVEKLREKLPGVEIDYRLGGLLGISGAETAPARVRGIQPGTVAATVDIQPQDIIRKFNGKPVANFKELTGEIAKHRPGEEISLEIERDKATLELKVKLGRWKAMQ